MLIDQFSDRSSPIIQHNIIIYNNCAIYEGHKEGVLFTVHEENKSPITVHEENKSPITVHEDNKHIYSTCCQFMKHVYDSTHNSHIYIYIYITCHI